MMHHKRTFDLGFARQVSILRLWTSGKFAEATIANNNTLYGDPAGPQLPVTA